jgi:hypothetical protein
MKSSVTLKRENFMISLVKMVFVKVVAVEAASTIFSISSEWEAVEVAVRNPVDLRRSSPLELKLRSLLKICTMVKKQMLKLRDTESAQNAMESVALILMLFKLARVAKVVECAQS